MNETTTETQVRLLLETDAVRFFRYLYHNPLTSYDLSVIVFDLTSNEDIPSFNNVAFKTTLKRSALIACVEQLVAFWSGGPQRFAPRGFPPDVLGVMAAVGEALLPGVGFAIIVGDAHASAYVSNGRRVDVKAMFENDLLPNWRREARSDLAPPEK